MTTTIRRSEAATFRTLGVDPAVVRSLADDGITLPRPIQAQTIAAALSGHDVCGQAPTGSGKTLAFGLPLVHLKRGDGRPVGLVIVPTRELALQIALVVRPLAKLRGLSVRALIGGTSVSADVSALARGVDLVVGCPGRMVDLQHRRVLDLSQARLAVVDEADRMADMGFMPDVTRLLDATACRDGQLLLFSATLNDEAAALVRRYQSDPVRVRVSPTTSNEGAVSHTWRVVDRAARRSATEDVLDAHRSAIVFTRTKRGADRLARQLSKGGRAAVAIHGDRSQNQRQRALAQFSDGRVGVLVATDVAARGIHVDDVDVVLHYDLPNSADDYTHRSGRTGRAGASGTVVALVCADATGDAGTLARSLPFQLDVHGALPGAGVAGATQVRPKPSGRDRRPRSGRSGRR